MTLLSTRVRKYLDEAMPLGVGASVPYRHLSDLLYPFDAVIDGGYVTPGADAGLDVDVTAGFLRDGSGNIIEIKPTSAVATANATSVGQSIVYRIVADEVTGVVTAVAGVAATSGSQIAPALATGKVSLATVLIVHGDTAPSAAHIDNTQRVIV